MYKSLQISPYKYIKSKVGRFISLEEEIIGITIIEEKKKKKKSQISLHLIFFSVVLRNDHILTPWG